MTSIETRFWAKVNKTDACWAWVGAKRRGYGIFYIDGKTVSAHRVSWMLRFGPIPVKHQRYRTFIMHTCDNPSCVNPAHLIPGTPQDNALDCARKGRMARLGEANGLSRLDRKMIRKIRQRVAQGAKDREIATEFSVRHSTVWKIRAGKLWGWYQPALSHSLGDAARKGVGK